MCKSCEAGSDAPGFTLPSDGGGEVSLAQFAGRNVIVFFYPKDDTPGCTQEALAFTGLHQTLFDLETEIVDISADSPKKHDKFKAKHGLSMVLASDETHDVLSAYGVWKEKSMYGRKFMGIERSTFLIDRAGRIARVWRKVKVKEHDEEVLDAVRQLSG